MYKVQGLASCGEENYYADGCLRSWWILHRVERERERAHTTHTHTPPFFFSFQNIENPVRKRKKNQSRGSANYMPPPLTQSISHVPFRSRFSVSVWPPFPSHLTSQTNYLLAHPGGTGSPALQHCRDYGHSSLRGGNPISIGSLLHTRRRSHVCMLDLYQAY